MSSAEPVAELAAIKALGPLFKMTEVFLWDDAMVSAPEASVHLDNMIEEPTIMQTSTVDINSSINEMMDDYTSLEDFELAKQMDALGLPISFSTTKEMNRVPIKGERKGIQPKYVSSSKNIENRVSGASRSCLLEDNSLSRVLHDSTNIPLYGKTTEGDVAAYDDVYENQDSCVIQLHSDLLSVPATVLGDIVEEQVCNDDPDAIITRSCEEEELSTRDPDMGTSAVMECAVSSGPENFPGNDLEDVKSGAQQREELFHKHILDNDLEGSSMSCNISGVNDNDDGMKNWNSCPTSMESSLSCASSHQNLSDYPENFICCKFGDWRVIWDPFYKRNYFYNFQSQESTWYPPSGLEHFASISNSNEFSNNTAEDHTDINFAGDATPKIDFHDSHDRTNLFQEKEDNFELIHSSAEVISSMMSDDIPVNFVSAHSDEHAIVKRIADEQVLLHTPTDHSTGDLDVNEYWKKQEKHVTFSEACSVADVSLELLISNSLTATINGRFSGEDGSGSPNTGVASSMDEWDSYHETASKKKKKRVRRLRSHHTLQGVDGALPASVVKYWCQRYLLFSQFDNGIKMDEEGWFSVTPESIARHHASRCGGGIIIDCFTGVGGNAIQFAKKSNHVIAVDIDLQKIDYAQHNAAIYGVSDRINFIVGDFLQIAPRLKGDVIYMSPPWGGPDYSKVEAYDIRTMLKPRDGQYLFEIARKIASKIVMFLPRNVDLNQLAELSLSVNPPWVLEVEKNFLNGRLKAITAYFDNPML